MGPPLTAWPHSHPKVSSDYTKCLLHLVDNIRTLGLNFTFGFILLQVLFNLSAVTAGPVVLNFDYLQGPVPVARNIRHLPCISRSTGHEGLCMFAIDCLKMNGTHLGTCIDRFYFGSCCQIPDKNTLPQIIGNNIEDNSIDSANFVHPLTEDKVHSTVNKIPNIFPNKHDSDLDKPPTINVDKKQPVDKLNSSTNKPSSSQDHTESNKLETKSDELTTLESKKDDDDKTTVIITPSTQFPKTTSQIIETTEAPIKLSTFQSVSGDNAATEKVDNVKPTKIETTEAPKPISEQVSTEKPSKPPVKPIRPTYKPRPTNRPLHISLKPKPTRPVTPFTRKPPYKPSSKRPLTKKPVTYPPRLNITIIPQSTSTRPVFTRPSVASITYINTTLPKVEERPTSSTSTTSTTTTTTTTTITTLPPPTTTIPPSTVTTTQAPKTTERITTIQSTIVTDTSPVTEVITDKQTDKTTIAESIETVTTESQEVVTQKDITQETEKITEKVQITERDTMKPTTEQDIATPESYTDFPQFITWSDYGSSSSKAPETTAAPGLDDGWSPITPPDGWVLLSTIPPKSTTTSTTTAATTTTSAAPTSDQTIVETSPSLTNEATTKSEVQTTEASIATSATSITSSPVYEFTVNITKYPSVSTSTLSTTLLEVSEETREPIPTISSTTSSVGLTTFTSISSENASSSVNVTDASTESVIEVSTETSEATTEAAISSTTPETYNMSNYKEVCGRRIWPQARIVGGSKSEFGQWPWQISLRQYRTSSYLHKCGAALLNENWAITAAHCVERVPPSDLLVRLGEYDLASDSEPYGFAERRVQIVASHPHFDPATFEYDLALLRFYEPVTFQPNILPVCVPDDDDDYVGRTAHVTGWGRLYDDGPLPSILQEVDVPVINNTACESMYLEAGYNEHIPHIFICAGWTKGGSDSCEGDSGGPMVVQRARDSRFVLSGIISWGIGCAEPNQPGVYTRISEFRDWINQILQF